DAGAKQAAHSAHHARERRSGARWRALAVPAQRLVVRDVRRRRRAARLRHGSRWTPRFRRRARKGARRDPFLPAGPNPELGRMKKILILGVNGFVGHHLTRRILSKTDWTVYGMDMHTERIEEFVGDPRFHFFEGDITINREWVEYHIKKCDVVLPLVAIATPADYVKRPLDVFELDFEANLPIVRACVSRGKRLVFPSTSEVYGMCEDEDFDPDSSNLVLGPISKQRWIYSCCKQLIDRVIWAYGAGGKLDFTL